MFVSSYFYVSSYYYMCVLILLDVSSYYYICVLILYMRPILALSGLLLPHEEYLFYMSFNMHCCMLAYADVC